MNDSGREHYDDEIDLFEIVEILWQGKWTIVASVLFALAAAYAYIMNKEVVYEYNLPYSFITAPDAVAFQHFLTQSVIFSPPEDASSSNTKTTPFSLDTEKRNVSLISIDPHYEEAISTEARVIGNKLTELLMSQAINELKLVNEDTSAQRLNSEVVAQHFFNAQSVLFKIKNGGSSIFFQPVVKTVKSPKISLILALSVVMGGMMGLFFIFLLRMVAAYKKRQQVAM